jgi:hypothetical protein
MFVHPTSPQGGARQLLPGFFFYNGAPALPAAMRTPRRQGECEPAPPHSITSSARRSSVTRWRGLALPLPRQ